jgi:hypothetical protein
MSYDHNYMDSMPEDGYHAIRQAAWIVLTLLLIVVVFSANAEAANPMSEANARYAQERAACLNGTSNQDRATCLKEAGAALKEAKAGHLNDAQQDFAANALARCKALPGEQQELCYRRMQGEGLVSGSVRDGGVYRELIVKEKTMPDSKPIQQR